MDTHSFRPHDISQYVQRYPLEYISIYMCINTFKCSVHYSEVKVLGNCDPCLMPELLFSPKDTAVASHLQGTSNV